MYGNWGANLKASEIVSFMLFPLLLVAVCARSEDVRFVSASFEHGIGLLREMDTPIKKHADEVRVYCFADLNRLGRFGKIFCRSDTDEVDWFTKKIARLVRSIHVEPARVGRKKVRVFMPFTVVAKSSDAGSTIAVFPHTFLNAGKYGVDYSAPQLYLPGAVKWHGCGSAFMAWVEVTVDETGVASNPRIVDAKSASEKCLVSLKKAAVEAKYIPAFSQGKPVSARYIEPYFTIYKW